MKKRVLTIAGILVVLIFVAVVIMSGEKKMKITAENGKEYWISYENNSTWVNPNSYRITLYDEKLNFLREFRTEGEPQRIEIKYDGTVDNLDFYRIYVFTEEEIVVRMWRECEGDIYGGGYISYYMRIHDYVETERNVFDELKAYALRKIGEGEYEWLYSYGDALISDGHTELTELIQRILEERKYSPNYITEDEFYSACEEILVKCNEGGAASYP